MPVNPGRGLRGRSAQNREGRAALPPSPGATAGSGGTGPSGHHRPRGRCPGAEELAGQDAPGAAAGRLSWKDTRVTCRPPAGRHCLCPPRCPAGPDRERAPRQTQERRPRQDPGVPGKHTPAPAPPPPVPPPRRLPSPG